MAVEQACHRAWPPIEQLALGDWILRFGNGFSKRINSATVLSSPTADMEERVAACESRYRERGLPCIFCLLSTVDTAPLEAFLQARGYADGEHAHVLVQDPAPSHSEAPEADTLPRERWRDAYGELRGNCDDERSAHLDLLARIEGAATYAVLRRDGIVAACGLEVVDGGYFGLFNFVTRASFRRQGCGTELLHRMLSSAVKHGARVAYLQALAQNEPAIRLYEGLGYRFSYAYRYLMREE